MLLPTCEAVITVVPGAKIVTTLPEIEATVGLELLYEIEFAAEVAEKAFNVIGSPTTFGAKVENVMA